MIHIIAERLEYFHVKNIVIDPVMVATSGAQLIKTDAMEALIKELFPLATVVTPNIPEAEVLAGMKIQTENEMEIAAKSISTSYGCSVLIKGGHNILNADDLLYSQGVCQWFRGNRIDNSNTHGTGCTLSSAIASNLAKGFSLMESIRLKEYISGALSAMLDLGKGSGPMKINSTCKVYLQKKRKKSGKEKKMRKDKTQMEAQNGNSNSGNENCCTKRISNRRRNPKPCSKRANSNCANRLHTCIEPNDRLYAAYQNQCELRGTRDCKDYNIEMEKVMAAVNMGAEAIMDLSSHGNTEPFRKKLVAECPAMIGTVPVYDSVIHYQRDLATLTAKDFIDVIRLHAAKRC